MKLYTTISVVSRIFIGLDGFSFRKISRKTEFRIIKRTSTWAGHGWNIQEKTLRNSPNISGVTRKKFVTPIFTFKKSKNQLRKFTPLSTSLCILL
jgi:hypothetical protein